MGVQTLVLVQRLNRNSPPHTGPHNFSWQHAGFRSNHGATLHMNVIAKAYLPADHTIIFNRDAAADSGLRRNQDPLADVAVMADVNHVVELRPPANSRAAQGSAID